MRLKEGVVLAGLDMRMRFALTVLDRVYKDNGRPEGVTITSGLDGEHSAGSMHYYGLALDTRIYYFDEETLAKVVGQLSDYLIGRYDVVLEKDHIHVEYRLL